MSLRGEIDKMRRDLPPVGDGSCPGGSPFVFAEEYADVPAVIEPDECKLCGKRHWPSGDGPFCAVVRAIDSTGRQLSKAEVEALRAA